MHRMLATLVSLGLLVTACGDGSDDGAQGDAGPAPTTAPATPGATDATSPPAATDAPVAIDGSVNDHGTVTLGADGRVAIEAGDLFFEPTYIRASGGEDVTVRVINRGDVQHTFTTDGGIDEVLDPGAERTVELVLPSDTSVVFYCRFHRSAGMQGAFAVEGSGAGEPGDTTDTSAIVGGEGGY